MVLRINLKNRELNNISYKYNLPNDKYMVKGGKKKDKRSCIYCTRPITPKEIKFTVTNMLSQLVGDIHAYCYPYKQTEFSNRGYGVVTNLGVVLLSPKS